LVVVVVRRLLLLPLSIWGPKKLVAPAQMQTLEQMAGSGEHLRNKNIF
jgi:hypothetical protein